MKGTSNQKTRGWSPDSNRSDWPPLNNRAPHLPRPSLSRLGDGGPRLPGTSCQWTTQLPGSSFPRTVHNSTITSLTNALTKPAASCNTVLDWPRKRDWWATSSRPGAAVRSRPIPEEVGRFESSTQGLKQSCVELSSAWSPMILSLNDWCRYRIKGIHSLGRVVGLGFPVRDHLRLFLSLVGPRPPHAVSSLSSSLRGGWTVEVQQT
jgi:hypothetical protein